MIYAWRSNGLCPYGTYYVDSTLPQAEVLNALAALNFLDSRFDSSSLPNDFKSSANTDMLLESKTAQPDYEFFSAGRFFHHMPSATASKYIVERIKGLAKKTYYFQPSALWTSFSQSSLNSLCSHWATPLPEPTNEHKRRWLINHETWIDWFVDEYKVRYQKKPDSLSKRGH